MRIRPTYSIIIFGLVLTLCAITWLIFQPRSITHTAIDKTDRPQTRTTETSQTAPTPETTQEEKGDLSLQEWAEKSKKGIVENVRIIRGVENDPSIEQLSNALEGPEYLEYLRQQEAEPGFDAVLYMDFLKDQGATELGGEQFMEDILRVYFPTGTAADHEPEMRKRFAEIALEYPSEDSHSILFDFFWEDSANAFWSFAHFRGYVGIFEWAENTHQNAASIVAEATTTIDTRIEPTSSQETPTPTPNSNDIAAESSAPSTQHEEPPPPQSNAQIPQSIETLEVELTPDILADIPTLSTNADFEQALRQHFSPQRFQSAVQTLNQYGPIEGLRRLKETDPEVATQIERLFQPKKETD